MEENCPSACGKCTQCKGPHDTACLVENRRRMNLLLEDPTKDMDWGEGDEDMDAIEGEEVVTN